MEKISNLFIMTRKKITATFILIFLLASCRGQISDKPPVHLNPNMDFQPKKNAQELSRDLPEGVVPFGASADPRDESRKKFLKENPAVYLGKNADGSYTPKVPLDVDYELVKRGQSRYNIYCAACHDRAGTSQSIIVKRGVGIPPPPMLASENLIDMPDGEIFEVITYGRRNMSGYATQIDVKDRWAIVAYVRALQKSRTKKFSELPETERYLLFKDSE